MNNIVLGTMNIGYPHTSSPRATIKDYTKIIETYLNCTPTSAAILDTAYYYGNTQCEQILGEILPTLSYLPKIATKVNPWLDNDFTNGKFGQLSGEGVLQQFTGSLKNLRVDNVEYLFLHCPDHETPLEETLYICNTLWRKEKFHKFGISNYSLLQTQQLLDVCEEEGYITPSCYQGMYNLISRKVEEIFPLLDNYNIDFWAYNPLAGGLLTGKYTSKPEEQQLSRFKNNSIYQNIYWKPTILQKWVPFFEQGVDVCTQQSFEWLQHYSKMRLFDKIILGASTEEQLTNNIQKIGVRQVTSKDLYFVNKLYSHVEHASPNYYY